MYEPYHPAVIRSLAYIGRVTRETGVRATVCGDLAGDYVVAMLLLALGYQGVNVSPHFLAEVRFGVRSTTLKRLQSLSEDLFNAEDEHQIQALFDGLRAELKDDMEAGLRA